LPTGIAAFAADVANAHENQTAARRRHRPGMKEYNQYF
jgi:hypothetical protein